MRCAYLVQVDESEEAFSRTWSDVELFRDRGEAMNLAANIALEKSERTRVIELCENGVSWNVTGETMQAKEVKQCTT